MIITLKGADFSSSNIGTLSTWSISRVLGTGATYSGVTYVDKGAALSATVTIADGYELGSAGVTVTMGGVAGSYATVDGSTVTISISSVTGNVVIKVPTVNSSTGEEDSETTYYIVTYKYVNADGNSIKSDTTESVAAGTSKTFSTSNAASISGYTVSSVSPTSATINSNTTVTYTYATNTTSSDGTIVALADTNNYESGTFLLANGNSTTLANYIPSQLIEVEGGKSYTVVHYAVHICHWLDETETFISGASNVSATNGSANTYTLTAPSTAKYIRMNTYVLQPNGTTITPV